jgi:hypothetical protein
MTFPEIPVADEISDVTLYMNFASDGSAAAVEIAEMIEAFPNISLNLNQSVEPLASGTEDSMPPATMCPS